MKKDVFVLDVHSKPLMPTTRTKARKLIKSGGAIIAGYSPFVIKLTYDGRSYRQDVKLGIDAGYQFIGYSAVTENEELFGGEVEMLKGQSSRYETRAMHRRNRRNRLRFRQPRWKNRSRSGIVYQDGLPIRVRYTNNQQSKSNDAQKSGWIAPSIQHRLDTHIKIINKVKSVLPIAETIIEVASFDIQAIKNPKIKGVEYQQGEQSGFWNLREYILHRDGHNCQNRDCTNKAKQKILQIHHLGFWKSPPDKTDRPSNLVTLCNKCHKPKNHQKSGFLYGWKPRLKPFRAETFMSTVRWRLVDATKSKYTYGYKTKSARIKHGIEKSHHNDAFVIAGGDTQKRTVSKNWRIFPHNKRAIEKFRDAVYIDSRTGDKAKGKDLSSGRTTRNKGLNGENLRIYRLQKHKNGIRSIQRKKYKYTNGDLVLYKNRKYICGGTGSYGYYLYLNDGDKKIKVKSRDVSLIAKQSGMLMTT